ncbi:hypothetical protein D7I46_11715 [Lactococcus allomyrinae]|uniref:Uncharacterized protein n=2 Tax=Lactococcus allomyrinae TaxID=2419773 RepID=A0A387BU61_9LACT|nr:hypothetical protein D7I46_11715 [Lactococcus allomyrinae]
MMTYTIKHIDNDYKMTAFGVTFDDFNDWTGNAAKTAEKKAEITENGKLAELLQASDGQEYQINYVIDGKAWRGFGVMGDFDIESSEVLDFLAGDYIVVSGENETADTLTGKVFGGLLQEITDYKYVGPGNYAFVSADGHGELWLRAEKISK